MYIHSDILCINVKTKTNVLSLIGFIDLTSKETQKNAMQKKIKLVKL